MMWVEYSHGRGFGDMILPFTDDHAEGVFFAPGQFDRNRSRHMRVNVGRMIAIPTVSVNCRFWCLCTETECHPEQSRIRELR